MLINNINFVEFLFQLTIFFLLFNFVFKYIKQYLIPELYKEVENIKKKETNLKEKNKLLVSSAKKIENQIDKQTKEFLFLDKKMQTSQKFFLEKKMEIDKNNEILKNKIQEKRKRQSKNLTLLKTQQIVIPKAVKLTYEEMVNLYKGEKSLNLLKELIERISFANKEPKKI